MILALILYKFTILQTQRGVATQFAKAHSGRTVHLICLLVWLFCILGFKVTLFVDADEYVGPLADSVGAVVSVYLPFTKSSTLGENPIYVAPGSFVSVSLMR